MKAVQVIAQKFNIIIINIPLRLGILILLGIAIFLMTACNGELPTNRSPRANQEQNALPDTEEFGLSKAELVQNIEDVETLIAQCMGDAGFEYIAADYNTVRRGMTSDKSLPGYSEREFINEFGFGISTLYTGLAPQLADKSTPAQVGLGEQNVQIFKNLPPADQVAYNFTLFGESTHTTFAVAIEIEDFSRTAGCTRTAIEQVFTPEQLSISYLSPKDALIEEDPRMIAAIVEFGACMRDAGFNYNHEREIEPDLRERLDAITSGTPVEALSSNAQATLIELQNYERALGIIALNCEVTILEPVEDQVERELYTQRDQQ